MPASNPQTPAALKLGELVVQLENPATAKIMWREVFSETERRQLGNDLPQAATRLGTVGMWLSVRPVARERAICDAALAMSFISARTHRWLLDEFEVSEDNPEAMAEMAADRYRIVLTGTPRGLWWHGEHVEIDWHQYPQGWSFLWELCHEGQNGDSVDSSHFEVGVSLKDMKYNLVHIADFPETLAASIKSGRDFSYRLDLPSSDIRIL